MHGGNLRWARETYKRDSFTDLSANINPYGPPEQVWQALQAHFRGIVHYPDPACRELRLAAAAKLNMVDESIMAGNGAGELIYTVIKALEPRKIVIPIPAFSEYERAAFTVGANISYIKLGAAGWDALENDFQSAWRQYLQGKDLLVICTPHNPTGTLLSPEHFQMILEVAGEAGCLVLCDESFIDFVPDDMRWSARTYLNANPHLIVIYSMTKFYSLPGLRLGLAFARPGLINRFEQFRDPWSVNYLAQLAGIVCLELTDNMFAAPVRVLLHDNKKAFYDGLNVETPGRFRPYRSAVNFVLIEVLDRPATDLVQQLALAGVLVRDCTNFKGLDGSFIRIAIKDRSSIINLLQAISRI